MNAKFTIFLFAIAAFSCFSDKGNTTRDTETPVRVVNVPPFNADSAYRFIEQQVAFGPRIPNSLAHKKTGDFLVNQFRGYGAEVITQEFDVTSYDNQRLFLRNIIASFFPEEPKRILLAAHWDTRPFADKDPDNPRAKFDGANDGGSGVGVLLEIARTISLSTPPEVGIDILLFDGEDWGFDSATARNYYGREVDFNLPKSLDSWWCLGSQHWSKNRHKPGYSAYYGILLDMVGAKDARFPREGASMEYAPRIVDKVWNAASGLGYGHIFINRKEASITDDHLFVNMYAKIPMINVVHYDPEGGFFGEAHHTRKDTMEIISKETLAAVGNTLLHVIYFERAGV